jgi:hypothetical protein
MLQLISCPRVRKQCHPEPNRGIPQRYLKTGNPESLDCVGDDDENLLGDATEAEKMTIRSSAFA